jgi:hypothetical protein
MSDFDERTDFEQALDSFKKYFKKDLTGYLNQREPLFRVATAGGYGLKVLLESKYEMYERIRTGDLDLTVSVYKSKMTPFDAYSYWMMKLLKFINEQKNPNDYKITCLDQGGQYVPIQDYKRHYIIMISFQYEDFVDIAINDMKIDGNVMDKHVSLKTGLPIKTLNSYLKDFLTIIYRANVQGVSSDVYKKRNPVSGHYYEKGLKDISRTKLICSIEKEHKNKYKKYCKIIVDITKERLRQMNAKERDEYFNILKELVPKIRNETSKKTN